MEVVGTGEAMKKKDLARLCLVHPFPPPPETTISTRPPCLRCGWPLSGSIIRMGEISCDICHAVNSLSPDMKVVSATIYPNTSANWVLDENEEWRMIDSRGKYV